MTGGRATALSLPRFSPSSFFPGLCSQGDERREVRPDGPRGRALCGGSLRTTQGSTRRFGLQWHISGFHGLASARLAACLLFRN